MSLLATTVSIVLTFGTTAIVDRRKQKAEKREMVLMVMYDMRESLSECEHSQKNLDTFCDLQVDLVAHPEKYPDSYVQLLAHVPILDYTTTTENIFKSNIETLSTIGNILFVETVSDFYAARDKIKTDVVEKFQREGEKTMGSFEGMSAFDAPSYAYLSEIYCQVMKWDYEECKTLMKVSEEDLDVFSKERKSVEESIIGDARFDMTNQIIQKRNQRRIDLENARKEGRKAIGED